MSEVRYVNGEPTDKQINFQDEVDNLIWETINKIERLYAESDEEIEELERVNELNVVIGWDIEKISRTRTAIEKALGLPELY